MPLSPLRYCYEPGCNQLTRKTNCDEHARERKKLAATKRPDPYYKSKPWKFIRNKQIIKAPFCEFMMDDGKPCNKIAKEIDHIIPRQFGGPDVPSNLQSLCHFHHSRKTVKERSIASGGYCEITLVCGPPGSGKTTYVLENKAPTDLVVDLDLLGKALTPGSGKHQSEEDAILPFTMSAYQAIIDRLCGRGHGIRRAWVIHTSAGKEKRQLLKEKLNAKALVLEVPADECKRRIAQDQNRRVSVDWEDLIDKWWSEYSPCDTDIRLVP